MSNTAPVRRWGLGIALVASIAPVLLLAAPASADTATSVTFLAESSMTTTFGGEWSLAVQVIGQEAGEEGYVPAQALGPNDGTVSATVSGVGGTFSTGIQIQEDGRAYITQPLNQPLLAAGDYQVTAIFTPGAGTGLSTSQTAVPASLTITPVTMSATAALVSDPTVSARPYIEASLSGDYVKETGGAPSGTWAFSLLDGETEVFGTEVAQAGGATDVLRVDVPTELRGGRELTLRSTFTPVAELAGGIELGTIADSTFATPGTGLLDLLSTRLSFPIWATFALSALIVALVALVIVFGIRLSRRGGAAPPADAADGPDDLDDETEALPRVILK